MKAFHGDLLVGGFALHGLHGELDGETNQNKHWSGRLEIEPTDRSAIEIGRQYLLLLDDGRNAEVMVTRCRSRATHDKVVCDFAPWGETVRPK